MVLLEDVAVGLSAGVAVASLIVVFALLSRYRALVKESTRSSDLAKSLWDAMNARLTTQDARIVDLMARFEVYSVKRAPLPPTAKNTLPTPASAQPPPSPSSGPVQQPSQPASRAPPPPPPPAQVPLTQSAPATKAAEATRETRHTILSALAEGPKTANQIRDVLDMTREHTGRLMKQLYGEGLVVRNDLNKPYVYEITDAGRRYLGGYQA